MNHPELQRVVAGWNVVPAPDTESWLAARRKYLTASDVAAVMGLHPYKGRASVLRDKCNPTPPKDRGYGIKAMRGGQFLEQGVFDWWLDDRRLRDLQPNIASFGSGVVGELCRGAGAASVLVAHPDAALRLAASPDAVLLTVDELGDPIVELVELKLCGPGDGSGNDGTWARWRQCRAEPGTDPKRTAAMARRIEAAVPNWATIDCPLEHWVQLQVQLACTGVRFGHVVGSCGTQREDHPFPFDAEFARRVERAALEFWADVDDTVSMEGF